MKHSRRTFFKQGLAGALLLGTSTIARAALPDPVTVSYTHLTLPTT